MSRGPSLSEIAQKLNEDPERWAPVIIGEDPNAAMSRRGIEHRFFKKGSLRVQLAGPKKGNWSDYSEKMPGKPFGDMLDLIAYMRGVTHIDAVKIAKDLLGLGNGEAIVLKPRQSDDELAEATKQDNEKRIRTARFIWSKSAGKLGKEAIEYLEGRAITKLSRIVPPSVRFRRLDRETLEKMHIEEKGQPRKFPNGLQAIVLGATTADGQIAAVQQIIIDGPKKADIDNKKRSNGLMEGAAVRLGEPEDKLTVGEGPETGFSCWEATDEPTWIALGASNLTRIPVPDRVKRIRFAVENDPSKTGLKACLKAANYWMAKGKDTELAFPRVVSDMNDVHRQCGLDAVREDLNSAITSERNPYRKADGALLSDEEQHELPVIITHSAEDALAAWIATGLCSIPLLKDVTSIAHLVPENAKKVLLVLVGDEHEPDLNLGEKIAVRTIRIQTPLATLHKETSGQTIRRLLRLNATPGMQQPIGVEELALHPDGPVILVTGRKAMDAAKELFPLSPILGFSPQADSLNIDWSALSGRSLLFAPANNVEHILAAEQAASDAIDFGAKEARVIKWPIIVPMRGGWRARSDVPENYDLRWLLSDGWTPRDMRHIINLATPIEKKTSAAA